jgi:hypothetical protein
MPAPALRRLSTGLGICALLGLAACDSKPMQNNSVTEMRDMEKVDGTITDAMTDLDGIRSEATAVVDTGTGNSSSAANASVPRAPAPDNSSSPAETSSSETAPAQ